MPDFDAMVLRAHGGPEVLTRERVSIADPGPREVQIAVRAVAMNHMDLWVRRGLPNLALSYPHRLGCDIAGVVEALGPGARGVAIGDEVMLQPGVSCGVCPACQAGADNLCKSYKILGESTSGGYGERVVVPDVNVLPKPTTLSFAEAAALPLCLLTAWQMVLRKGEACAGQTVLVHAAGSGVSSLAIQLCKLVGARVVATTGTEAKAERARALGADHVINYATEDFVAEVRRLTGKVGADLVLDHVGGEILEKSVAATRWGGRIVTCGATAGFTPRIDLRHIFFRQIELRGSTMGRRGDLHEALPLVAAGRVRPVVDRVMPLWDARDAHALLEARAVFGKIVLAVA
ncbi:MAG: zinc-binding dehydrogenase [Polyangiaceae bacterium]|nr:zinc-binding dehydrogenase [Polyangiaceae bacterium]